MRYILFVDDIADSSSLDEARLRYLASKIEQWSGRSTAVVDEDCLEDRERLSANHASP